MNTLSLANWKRFCWWVMVVCLALALCYGSLWYVEQKAEDTPTPIAKSAPSPSKPPSPPTTHPVVREKIQSHGPPMFAVCDYDVDVPDKYKFGSEAYLQQLRKAECEGREIR